jgi:hypothetical protein
MRKHTNKRRENRNNRTNVTDEPAQTTIACRVVSSTRFDAMLMCKDVLSSINTPSRTFVMVLLILTFFLFTIKFNLHDDNG